MKRGPLLLLMLLTAFQALACVAGEGELRVRNRTAGDIWVSVDNSEPRRISGWSNWSLFYRENRVLNVSYIGNYVLSNSVEQTVRPGLVTTTEVLPSGGAIALANDSQQAIIEVYISPSEEQDWGPNDLAGSLGPGQSTLWTVTEGIWDLKLVDGDYREYFHYRIEVTVNQTQSLNLSGFSKSADAPQSKKTQTEGSDNPPQNE